MYRRWAAILFPLTLIALVGVSAWGYQENQEKNAILIKAENQYQRAFHELSSHMDQLQGEIGKSLAINSRKQTASSLTNVWRLAYSAHNDIGQLPMSLMPFHQTESFLGKIGSFAHKVGVRDLNEEPLTEKEWKTLQTLYQRSHEVQDQLKTVQDKVLNDNLRWMDVEMALASEERKTDNSIIDGFKKVDTTVEHYPEMDWGPTVNNMEVREREKGKKLTGKKISTEQAKQKVVKLFQDKPLSRSKMTATLHKRGDYPTYTISQKLNQGTFSADITQVGGQLIWMIEDRPVGKAKVNYDQARKKAERFLSRIGYNHMEVISYEQTDSSVSFNFVHKQGEVYVYPEAAAVKIALDNGEVIGVQDDEYVFNKIEKVPQNPKLTEAKARKFVSPHIKIEKVNLAYIYNEEGNGVLCYEFLGRLDKEQYRVFINANSGDEEYIQQVKKG